MPRLFLPVRIAATDPAETAALRFRRDSLSYKPQRGFLYERRHVRITTTPGEIIATDFTPEELLQFAFNAASAVPNNVVSLPKRSKHNVVDLFTRKR
jgi:hypothetical protein